MQPSILIIEDHKSTRDSLAKLFRLNDWEAFTVADGFEAHRYLHSGVRDPHDVYMVDLKLPGESGVTIIDLIRLTGLRSAKTGNPVRVIAYTAWDESDEVVQAAIAAGADEVVIKSGNFDHLKAVVMGVEPGDVAMEGQGKG